MPDGVVVNLSDLTTFAKSTGKVVDTYNEAAYNYVADLTAISQIMKMETMGSLNEAAAYAEYHQVVSQSLYSFIGDLMVGLSALAMGAEICAINYANMDDLNAESLRSKNPTFSDICIPITGKATITSAEVDGAFTPAPENAPASNTNPTSNQSASDAATEYNNRVTQTTEFYANYGYTDPGTKGLIDGSGGDIGNAGYTIHVNADQDLNSALEKPTTITPSKS